MERAKDALQFLDFHQDRLRLIGMVGWAIEDDGVQKIQQPAGRFHISQTASLLKANPNRIGEIWLAGEIQRDG